MKSHEPLGNDSESEGVGESERERERGGGGRRQSKIVSRRQRDERDVHAHEMRSSDRKSKIYLEIEIPTLELNHAFRPPPLAIASSRSVSARIYSVSIAVPPSMPLNS